MTRVSPADIEAAQSTPIASLVGQFIPLNRQGFGLCPFHDERTPSFHVEPKRNVFCCFGCGAKGGPIFFLQKFRRLDFVAAVQALTGSVIADPARVVERRTATRRDKPGETGNNSAEYIASLWRGADHPELAELHLASRGINLRPKPLPAAIRGHHHVRCTEDHGKYRPAVLAAISGPSGAITALQRIYVERLLVSENGRSPEKGTRATDLATPKKTIGTMEDGAVQLADAGSILGLTEGVEDALAVQQLFRTPCWAAVGAARMAKIWIPDTVEHLIIFADADEAGRRAAEDARKAHRGRRVDIIYPTAPHKDFCEMLP